MLPFARTTTTDTFGNDGSETHSAERSSSVAQNAAALLTPDVAAASPRGAMGQGCTRTVFSHSGDHCICRVEKRGLTRLSEYLEQLLLWLLVVLFHNSKCQESFSTDSNNYGTSCWIRCKTNLHFER